MFDVPTYVDLATPDRSIQYAPELRKTAMIVRARINRSMGSDQFSTYRRSSRIASSHDRSDRPETCHSPGQPRLDDQPTAHVERILGYLTRQWRTGTKANLVGGETAVEVRCWSTW